MLDASICAMGSAASIPACTIAIPAMLEADSPRAAIAAAALRIAPAAHEGGSPPWKSCIKVSNSVFTEAASFFAMVASTLPWSTVEPDTS